MRKIKTGIGYPAHRSLYWQISKDVCFLLAEGGRIIRAERREDLRARAGLTEESLSALEAVCGKTAGDAGYEEAVGLAAVLFAAGFTAEEAQRFSPASGGGSFSKSGAGRS